MVRVHDLAGDARVLYGPLSQRPTPAEAGSGALWVDPADQTLYHVQSGNWVTVSPASDGGGGGAPAGTPVLYGPYTVDYTDIAHNGDTLTLWTPQVGDVLLRLFPDPSTVVQWDQGSRLMVVRYYNVDGYSQVAYADCQHIGGATSEQALDNIQTTIANDATVDGNFTAVTASIFHTTAPVQVVYEDDADTPVLATQGHVDIFALIARAVTP